MTINQALGELVKDEFLIKKLQAIRDKHPKVCKVYRPEPRTRFPELFVDVPDSWPRIILAPLYDVHLGHSKHISDMFERHLKWIARTPYVLTFDGGDLIENSSKLSVGSGVYEQDLTPDNQVLSALEVMATIWHKMLFKLPGNHEARTCQLGIDIGGWMASMMEVPYFADFCFCTIRWRGNNFRLVAHHGTGASTTAGAQRNAARKFQPWSRADIYWTGHLHNELCDPIYQIDYDKNGRMYDRHGVVMISKSYMDYFGTYAAAKALPPGIPGLTALTLQPDGRIDTELHANGRRL